MASSQCFLYPLTSCSHAYTTELWSWPLYSIDCYGQLSSSSQSPAVSKRLSNITPLYLHAYLTLTWFGVLFLVLLLSVWPFFCSGFSDLFELFKEKLEVQWTPQLWFGKVFWRLWIEIRDTVTTLCHNQPTVEMRSRDNHNTKQRAWQPQTVSRLFTAWDNKLALQTPRTVNPNIYPCESALSFNWQQAEHAHSPTKLTTRPRLAQDSTRHQSTTLLLRATTCCYELQLDPLATLACWE